MYLNKMVESAVSKKTIHYLFQNIQKKHETTMKVSMLLSNMQKNSIPKSISEDLYFPDLVNSW
jgi:hypothetical protein